MAREVLSIGVGQCGVQLGHEVWQQYNAEHEIDEHSKENLKWIKVGPTKKTDDDRSFGAFYAQTLSGHFEPRNIFVDTQPNTIDNLKNSDCKWMYPDSMLLSGKKDTGCNFAAGHYTVGKEMIDTVLDAVRKQVDECDNLQGFIMTHSVGGGTGSGLGALILERLAADYRKKTKMGLEVYPSPVISSSVAEPYNALLATHCLIEHTELSLVFDNEAIYELCQQKLDIKRPSYANLNRLNAKPISGATGFLRFEGEVNEDLNELATNLVPFPRLHFILPSFAPIVPSWRMGLFRDDVQTITESCFSASNFFVKCPEFDCEEDECCYSAISVYYTGKVKAREANATVQWLKTNKKVTFDTWAPTGFKVRLNARTPTIRETDDLAASTRTCTSLGNNVYMEQFLRNRISKKYDLLYSRRAFVHCFVAEGMEEGELAEAREDLRFIERDYRDVYISQATDESYEDDED